jgi:hypothetical protein
MSVTIWDYDYFDGDSAYFPAGYTPDLSNYSQDSGYTWDNDISSLYTTDTLYVFTGANYTGYMKVLEPGYHSGYELGFYYNNTISSFYTV